MEFFVLKENILLWCSQPSILPTTNITRQIFLFDGLAWKHTSAQRLQSSYRRHKRKVFFILWLGLKRKHYPMYIISKAKCTTKISVWRSDLRTWFHADCCHSNCQMLKRKVFFVSWPGLKMFYSVYYWSQAHRKYFCLRVRLENIILWRLSVKII